MSSSCWREPARTVLAAESARSTLLRAAWEHERACRPGAEGTSDGLGQLGISGVYASRVSSREVNNGEQVSLQIKRPK